MRIRKKRLCSFLKADKWDNRFLILFVILLFRFSIVKLVLMKRLKHLLERSAFGVCSYLGEKMGIASATVRLYFIYLTFAALGSPVLVYLFVAFWLNIKRYVKSGKRVIWG